MPAHLIDTIIAITWLLLLVIGAPCGIVTYLDLFPQELFLDQDQTET